MRIAIATDWFAPRQGGIESQLAALADRLARRGHEVTVITSTPGASNGTRYAIRRLDGPRLPFTQVAISARLGADLRTAIGDGFDVVHAHVSVVSPVGYLAALAAASARVPTVITFHSVLRLTRFVLAAATATLGLRRLPVVWSAVSHMVAEQARAALRSGDVAVLPNGIDLGFWRGTRSRSERDTALFVCAMRLHRKKRPRALVDAFAAAMARTRHPARLVLAGAGPELPALRRQIARRGADIELIGWRDARALRDLYREASAFILPSRDESFGIAALEARAAGLPVIASRHAGCREFLRDGGDAMLCDTDGDFAAAIARFISEPELRSRLASEPASLERYDWSGVLAAHERLYGRAIAAVPRTAVAAAPA
jgi:glycosyltransferase involved in cell wall biosynthesis